MKILYHHRTLGDGAEGIHIQSIVHQLKELGHEVKVVSLVGENTEFRSAQEAKESKWDKIKALIPGPVYELAEIAYNLKGYKMLRRAIKDFQPDLVYDRYAHFSFSAEWAASKAGVPLILEVNSPYSIQKRQWEKVYFPGLSELGERKIFTNAPHIIVVSSPLKQIVQQYGVAEEKITVLPNGTNPEHFKSIPAPEQLLDELQIKGKTVLGFVGILRRWHNIDHLINILEEIDLKKNNAVMLFLGDGPSYNELQEYNRQKGNQDTIKFLGRIPHNRIQEYISCFDIAISPHATPYSSPMKILEYMAMGKAILAPDMPNIRDLITQEKSGLLFQADDSAELKEKLLRLMEDVDYRNSLGQTALQRVGEEFSWRKNAEKTVALALNLINNKKK